MAQLRTERGLDRLVNFTDAAVAIAITLLILPLVDLAGEIAETDLGTFFAENVGAFVAFVVTFLVIGRFWMIHHRVFEFVGSYSSTLIWLDLAWLASIVFLPFAANAVSALPTDAGGVYAVYIGTMFVATLAMLLMTVLMRARPGLLVPEARGAIDLVPGISFLLLEAAAGGLALAFPHVGMYWLFLLFLAGPVGLALTAVFPALRPTSSLASSDDLDS